MATNTDGKQPEKKDIITMSEEDSKKAQKKGGLFGDPVLVIE